MQRYAKSLAMLTAMLVTGFTPTLAQEATAPKSALATQAQLPPRSFKLDYTLSETQGGKKIDSRQYTLSLGGGGSNGQVWQGQVQIGTRVPAGVKTDGTAQYLDVGTRINSSLQPRDGGEVLDTYCDVTSVASDDAKSDVRPILRTLSIHNNMPVVEGKPLLVGIADDPNSSKEFQLEVTVTELK